jgi:hypothetical protein
VHGLLALIGTQQILKKKKCKNLKNDLQLINTSSDKTPPQHVTLKWILEETAYYLPLIPLSRQIALILSYMKLIREPSPIMRRKGENYNKDI